MRTIRTKRRADRFLAALGAGCSVRAACEAAGISRSAAFAWKQDDPQFHAVWEAAVETGTDRLEDEAIRRALAGSDMLLWQLLRARRRSVYGAERREIAIGGLEGAPPINTAQQGQVIIYLPHNGREAPPFHAPAASVD